MKAYDTIACCQVVSFLPRKREVKRRLWASILFESWSNEAGSFHKTVRITLHSANVHACISMRFKTSSVLPAQDLETCGRISAFICAPSQGRAGGFSVGVPLHAH